MKRSRTSVLAVAVTSLVALALSFGPSSAQTPPGGGFVPSTPPVIGGVCGPGSAVVAVARGRGVVTCGGLGSGSGSIAITVAAPIVGTGSGGSPISLSIGTGLLVSAGNLIADLGTGLTIVANHITLADTAVTPGPYVNTAGATATATAAAITALVAALPGLLAQTDAAAALAAVDAPKS